MTKLLTQYLIRQAAKAEGVEPEKITSRYFSEITGVDKTTAAAIMAERTPRHRTLSAIHDRTGWPLERMVDLAGLVQGTRYDPPRSSEWLSPGDRRLVTELINRLAEQRKAQADAQARADAAEDTASG